MDVLSVGVASVRISEPAARGPFGNPNAGAGVAVLGLGETIAVSENCLMLGVGSPVAASPSTPRAGT